MSSSFVKRRNAIGWDWYLEDEDGNSSWVSHMVKEHIESLDADCERMFQANVEKNNEILRLVKENAKLRELARAAWRCIHTGASCSDCRLIAGGCTLQTAMRELGVGADE